MEAMRSSKLIYIPNLMFNIILFHMCDRTLYTLSLQKGIAFRIDAATFFSKI